MKPLHATYWSWVLREFEQAVEELAPTDLGISDRQQLYGKSGTVIIDELGPKLGPSISETPVNTGDSNDN